jgi:hypothetical protein
MLAVTFASFAVLVLAGGWIDYDLLRQLSSKQVSNDIGVIK